MENLGQLGNFGFYVGSLLIAVILIGAVHNTIIKPTTVFIRYMVRQSPSTLVLILTIIIMIISIINISLS